MKTILIAILAGGGAGVAGSLASQAFCPMSAPRPADSELTPRSQGVTRNVDDLAGLRTELASLRQANERLEARLAGIELGNREGRAPASTVESEQLASLQNELADLMYALRTPDAPPPASLRTAVRRTLDDVREEEEQQRQLEREQERVQRLEQRIDRMVGELELAPYQVEQFRKAMAESEARREAAMALARDGADWGQAREAMRDLREQSQASFSAILTPEQLEKFGDLQNPRGFRGGGNNPGGGGRRGAGGDGSAGQ